MTTDMPTSHPSPRKRNISRWLLIIVVGMLGWGGWREYSFCSALRQAKALGWRVEYIPSDPLGSIKKNWRATFKRATWMSFVEVVDIPDNPPVPPDLAIVVKLNPRALFIRDAEKIRDLSALNRLSRIEDLRIFEGTQLTDVDWIKGFSRLKSLDLSRCNEIKSIDSLRGLSALRELSLAHCYQLTHLDALTDLKALEKVEIIHCWKISNVDGLMKLNPRCRIFLYEPKGLPKERIAALKAAFPNAEIRESP